MAVVHGKATLMIGASAGSKVTITNLKRVRYNRGPPNRTKPQLVMNTSPPTGWSQGHKWVEGEIHVLSEAKAAFMDQGVAYIDEDGDNVLIPYAVLTLTTTAGGTIVKTFTGFIIDSVEEPYADGEDTIWVYKFKAFYVDQT